MIYTLYLDLDPTFYEAGFSAQHTQYLVHDEEGIPVADYRIKMLGSKNYMITDKSIDLKLDSVHTRKAAVERILQEHPEDEGYEIEEYLSVEPLETAVKIIDDHITRIVQDIYECKQLEVEHINVVPVMCVDSDSNFRKKIATIQDYKGNRKEMEKPVHYDALKQHVIDKYNPILVTNIETDDYIAAMCWNDYISTFCNNLPPTVIAGTIDKDFRSFPGLRWFWRNRVVEETASGKWVPDTTKCLELISFREAMRHFYKQMITGDASDNILGCKGERGKPCGGEKTAVKALQDCESVAEMYEACIPFYVKKYEPDLEGIDDPLLAPVAYEDYQGCNRKATLADIMEENARLLWMQHQLGEEIYLWKQSDMLELEVIFRGNDEAKK